MSDEGVTGSGASGGEATHRAFWADAVADRVVRRVEDAVASGERSEDAPIVVKGGISPSGVPHLGNVNEIMRGYFIAECLRDRGYTVRQVFTTDDRDPLRSVPRTLADLDGDLVDLGDVDAGALGRNLGRPYTDVPDPFGCCDSYGDHFTRLIERSADALGVPIEVVSTTALYADGSMAAVTERLLRNVDAARETLAAYQEKVDGDYVPFNPLCENCGHLTEHVTGIDIEAAPPTVDYRCSDVEAGDHTIEGCGHEGTATLSEGKLPWRFEWPAQWAALDVDVEPFGKDHAEGSWPSGQEIARDLLGIAPPEPMTYEWFTVDGEPLSSSAGNVVLVSDVLEMIEPEVLRWFFAKDPSRGRDFSIERIDRLVDEFDRVEARYYDTEHADAGDSVSEPASAEAAAAETPDHSTAVDRDLADRVYPFLVLPADVPAAALDDLDAVPFDSRGAYAPNDQAHRAARRALVDGPCADRIRFPYTFAAVLGMFEDLDARADFARSAGHLPDDAPAWAVEDAWDRVGGAREWAARVDNEYNYRIATHLPDITVDEPTAAALDDLADIVASGADGEAIHEAVFEIARDHGLEPSDLFTAVYRLLFERDRGPRLGPFLARLDREFVVDRLRREG